MPEDPENPGKSPKIPETRCKAPAPIDAEVIPPRKRGRPSKRTPEIEAAIFDCLRLGMSIPQTCDACGISPTQFRNWRKHYRDFQDLIRRAEAEAVKYSLAVIHAAAAQRWQAAAWFLERRHPEQWGRTETLSIQAKREAIREAVEVTAAGKRTAAQLKELRQVLGLPKDADAETVEAAIQHAKDENLRRKMSEIMGTPYTPQPFTGIPEKKHQGMTDSAVAKVDKLLLGDMPPTRAERIAALLEVQAKAREIAGKPPLPTAEAFEAAARELDGGQSDTRKPGG